MATSALGSRPRLTEAYSFLVDISLVTRWFDIFDDLGIQKQVLNLSVRAHPFDASLSLFDMLKVWVEREEPPATWEALIHAIRYKLLEGKIADKMARRYCPQACSPNDPGSEDEEAYIMEDPFSGTVDEDSYEFSRALLDVTEKLPRLSYLELYHYLKELRCPDGYQVVDRDDLKDRRSADALILPLVCSNLCNGRDVDLLVHLLTVLGHEEVLGVLRAYIPKIGVGKPSKPTLQDPTRFFAVRPILNAAIKRIDLAVVSVVKQELCVCFGLSEKPYLMQYTSRWSANPIKLCFQLPLSRAGRIQEKITAASRGLLSKGIVSVEVEINTTVFTYPVSQ